MVALDGIRVWLRCARAPFWQTATPYGGWGSTIPGSRSLFISGRWRERPCCRAAVQGIFVIPFILSILSFLLPFPVSLSVPHRASPHRDRSGKRQETG